MISCFIPAKNWLLSQLFGKCTRHQLICFTVLDRLYFTASPMITGDKDDQIFYDIGESLVKVPSVVGDQ
ncbi:MAG: hypothetical protein U9P37_04785 [Pseudomonadota bacterium]|nr:hypothetical protein [Pseudomonadota bacterium]